jgi:hypothetical protein
MNEATHGRPSARAQIAFGVIAMDLLLLQIVQSRFFAATLTYYYAFMLISLAMLGLAAGGMAVRLFPRLIPAERVWERAGALSAAMGAAVFAGTLGMLAVYPKVALSDYMTLYEQTPWALAAVFWCTFPAFLLGGTVISGVLAAQKHVFHRLYAVDLGSAALGCLLALFFLDGGTPVEALLGVASSLPMLAGALFAFEAKAVYLTFGCLSLSSLVLAAGQQLTHEPARAKPPHIAYTRRVEVLSEWSATSAVRVYQGGFFTWSLSPLYRGPRFPMLDLVIDGMGGTPIVQFDGRAESLAAYAYLDADLTALPHHLLPRDARQLIIGPGGGVDVLQAVRAGHRDVTAVEINPLIERVVNEQLQPFSGAPYRLPGVRTVIGNGRTFVKRATERWDLVTLTWVDTGGSATALAFSENYLYTVEAFEEYLGHLSDRGTIAFLRSWDSGVVVDSMRGVSVAMEALRRRGAEHPEQHLLIAASKSPVFPRTMCLVLVSRLPFSAERVADAQRFLGERAFYPVWLPGATPPLSELPADLRDVASVLHDIVTTSDPERTYREARYDVAPSTDDNPFYFVERAGPNRAAGIGVSQLSTYLVILAALVVPFLLGPAFSIARKGAALRPRDLVPLGYFALLGLSFMLVEIDFFHMMALLLGQPTLTLAVVLSSLLVFSGLGSLVGERLATGSPRRVLVFFAVLTLQLGLFAGFGARAVDALVHLDLGARVAFTIAVVAPIAFCMGMPLPAGMRLVRERDALVLWGWAINGAVSVFASLCAIYVAIHFGIGRTFAVGCVGYACAGLLLWREVRAARRAESPAPAHETGTAAAA